MTVTMCTSGVVKVKATSSVSSAITDAQYTILINQAESRINVEAKKNFTDGYAGYNDDTKKMLEDCASSLAAIGAINYDTSGFPSRYAAQLAMDYNWATAQDILAILKKQEHSDNLINA